MKYVKISNAGEIEPNAFKLIGASSKRSDNSKIGFFGSGLKYAMAFMLREGIKFRVFSGDNEVEVGTERVIHRGQNFDMIKVDGQDTSMTTDMGPKWKHWGAIREIYCNAVDEGDDAITVVDESEIKSETGRTCFYIQLTGDMTSIIDNWDLHFSKERRDLVCEVSGGEQGSGKVYRSMDKCAVIYRKGIQCHVEPNITSCYHYDFPWVEINESREIESQWSFRMVMTRFIYRNMPAGALKDLLYKIDAGAADYEARLPWETGITSINVDAWTTACQGKTIIVAEVAGWYSDRLTNSRDEYLLLPAHMVSKIRQHAPDIRVLGENVNGRQFEKVQMTEKQKFLLKDVGKFFDEAGYSIDYPINVVKFHDNYILGYAHSGTIYISEKVFDQGRRKLAETIYEESEHLKTNHQDETRAFQDHLISQVISRMEEKHAFFL